MSRRTGEIREYQNVILFGEETLIRIAITAQYQFFDVLGDFALFPEEKFHLPPIPERSVLAKNAIRSKAHCLSLLIARRGFRDAKYKFPSCNKTACTRALSPREFVMAEK